MKLIFVFLTACCIAVLPAFADTLVLKSGQSIDGTILRTNDGQYLVLTDFGLYKFAQTSMKNVTWEDKPSTVKSGESRLPNFRTAVLSLNEQSWANELQQIPATVIDKGSFRNVPYVSLRCGGDYEINIYGDLKNPAAIEVGLYRSLLDNNAAKQNCIKFMAGLLGQSADRGILQSLNLEKDLVIRNKMTFEITPPTADDAYLGWWVSAYFEEDLNRSRASEKEMATITMPKDSAESSYDGTSWSATEMQMARSEPETITFVNPSGDIISNAVVVRVIDYSYLIWRREGSGGKIALSDLPESIRRRFGYDKTHADSVYAADDQKRKAQAQALAAQAAQAQARSVPAANPSDYNSTGNYGDYGGYSSRSYVPSHGGSVYVHGYTRRDGTYVHSYTRRK